MLINKNKGCEKEEKIEKEGSKESKRRPDASPQVEDHGPREVRQVAQVLERVRLVEGRLVFLLKEIRF